jgi:dihydroneopterin aldolase
LDRDISIHSADTVSGHGFEYSCRIGFHEFERHIEQQLRIDFEAETDWREQARADRADGLVDYYEVNRAISALIAGREWRLVEAVAESVAELLCTQFPVTRAHVRVTKNPFDMPNCGSVSVACTRERSDFASS